jgi:hypothetical protein
MSGNTFQRIKTQLNENLCRNFVIISGTYQIALTTFTIDPESENYCDNPYCYDDLIFAVIDSVILFN